MSEWNVPYELANGGLIRVLEVMPAIPRLASFHPGHRHVPTGLRTLIELVREQA